MIDHNTPPAPIIPTDVEGTANPESTTIRDVGILTRGLFDSRLQSWLTRGMLTAIQRLSIVAAAILPVVGSVLAFLYLPRSWAIFCLLVVAPVLYVVVLVAIRLILGFVLILIDFLEKLMQLPASVDALTAEVRVLHGEVSVLREGVSDLRNTVVPLGSGVESLNSQVDHLKGSLESAQFWRAPSKWLRTRPHDE